MNQENGSGSKGGRQLDARGSAADQAASFKTPSQIFEDFAGKVRL